ncbi:MAG: hypothetical protein C5B49_11150 [Bdellovibrio sp.]|nr:MAG: hypothetical protein C5B49_11150 [Bdellovibrio sp.]
MEGNNMAFVLGLFFSVVARAAPGDVIALTRLTAFSVTDVAYYRKQFFDPQLQATLPDIKNGVVLYKVVYETIDLEHNPSKASGLLIVPDIQGSFAVVSYQHGTQSNRKDVPSAANGEGQLIALTFGASGFVVSATDYLGLGDSPGFHPYLHAGSEAWAAADMLRATRKAAATLKLGLNSRLFLTGYSQGGHSTMALHRYLETKLAKEFQVAASAPMSGPYDLSGITLQGTLRNPSANASAYVAYALLAQSQIYQHDSWLESAIQPDVLAMLPDLFDGTHELSDIASALPTTPARVLDPKFFRELLNNDRYNVALRDLRRNDVADWKALAPIHLCFGKADRDVPYQNALIAFAHMTILGSSVELVNAGDHLDHSSAAKPCFVQTAKWFVSL